MIRWFTDSMRKRAGCNEAQSARVENVGVLVASGLIAGEALAGLVTATFQFMDWPLPNLQELASRLMSHGLGTIPYRLVFGAPYVSGLVVMALIALALIRIPMKNAGDPNEPAPPAAIM
jgi:hypothetical protein